MHYALHPQSDSEILNFKSKKKERKERKKKEKRKEKKRMGE